MFAFIVLAIIVLVLGLFSWWLERKWWNGGKCRQCGTHWLAFDVDSSGATGHKCRCGHNVRTLLLGDLTTYAPAYTGSGTLTYTAVTSTIIRYRLIGNSLKVQWFLSGTIGGAGAEIRIALPMDLVADEDAVMFQWYVWSRGRRYNLGKPRNAPPGWLSRLVVWGVMAPRCGRLCWERDHSALIDFHHRLAL